MKKNHPIELCRTLLTETQTSLNGLAGELSETSRSPIEALSAKVKAFVADLPSIDDLKMDDAAIESLNEIIATTQKLTATLVEAVRAQATAAAKAVTDAAAAATAALTEKTTAGTTITSLNTKILEFETQVKDGKLVAKEKLDQLVELARKEGEKDARTAMQVVSTRRTAVSKAGLPEPVSEDFLQGTDDEFKTRQETADTRVKDLTKKYASLNGSTALRDLAWAGKEEYERGLALIEGALKPRQGRQEPLLGGGGGGGQRASLGAM